MPAFQKTQTDIPDILCIMTHKSLRSGLQSLADVWRRVATDSKNSISELLQRVAGKFCQNILYTYLRRAQGPQFVGKLTRKPYFPIWSVDMIKKWSMVDILWKEWEKRGSRGILGEWLSGNVLQGLLRSQSYKKQKPDHTGLLLEQALLTNIRTETKPHACDLRGERWPKSY